MASDDLYRSALKARLAKLPPVPPWETVAPESSGSSSYGGDDDDDDEEEGDTIGHLPSLSNSRTSRSGPSQDLSPLSAAPHFAQSLQLSLPDRGLDMRVYYSPPVLPPSTSPTATSAKGTVMLTHHGAGSSALSFALLSSAVRERSGGELGMLAFDCRGHGKTKCTDADGKGDRALDVDTLAGDVAALIPALFAEPANAPAILLVGHSMGASVVLSALPPLLKSGYSVLGIVVIDVVEGTAMEALPHMRHLLLSRPKGFATIEEAIGWHVTTNTIRNTLSARTSIPSLFIPNPVGPDAQPAWIWRAPLEETEPFWEGWFEHLSAHFLAAPCARLLLLAGTERLDRALTIGQMQGKFQLEVLPGVGHYVHEDDPGKTADVLVGFWRRNERVVVVRPGGGTGKGVSVKRVGER